MSVLAVIGTFLLGVVAIAAFCAIEYAVGWLYYRIVQGGVEYWDDPPPFIVGLVITFLVPIAVGIIYVIGLGALRAMGHALGWW